MVPSTKLGRRCLATPVSEWDHLQLRASLPRAGAVTFECIQSCAAPRYTPIESANGLLKKRRYASTRRNGLAESSNHAQCTSQAFRPLLRCLILRSGNATRSTQTSSRRPPYHLSTPSCFSTFLTTILALGLQNCNLITSAFLWSSRILSKSGRSPGRHLSRTTSISSAEIFTSELYHASRSCSVRKLGNMSRNLKSPIGRLNSGKYKKYTDLIHASSAGVHACK
jgi:hypothetical protein